MAKKTRKKSKTKKKPKVKTNHTIGVLHLGTKDVFENLVELMRQAAEDFLHTNGAPNDTVNVYGGGHYAEDNMRDLDKLADDLVNNTDASPIVAAGGRRALWGPRPAHPAAAGNTSRPPPAIGTAAAGRYGDRAMRTLRRLAVRADRRPAIGAAAARARQ